MKLLLTLTFAVTATLSLFANPTLVKIADASAMNSFSLDNYSRSRNQPGFPHGTTMYVSSAGKIYKLDGTENSGLVLSRYYVDIYDYVGEYLVFFGRKALHGGLKKVGLFLTDGTGSGTIEIYSYTVDHGEYPHPSSFVSDSFVVAPGNIIYYWGTTVTGATYKLYKYEVSINVPEEQQLDIEDDDVRVVGDSIVNLLKLPFPDITYAPENSKLSVAIGGSTLSFDDKNLWKRKKEGVFTYQSKNEPRARLTIDTNKKEWSLFYKQDGFLKNENFDKQVPIKIIIDDVAYGNAVQVKKKEIGTANNVTFISKFMA